MKREDRRKYEMFRSVGDFGTRNEALFPKSSKSGQTFDRVTQAAVQMRSQEETKQQAMHDSGTGKDDAREAVLAWMSKVARAVRGIARTGAGDVGELTMPGKSSDLSLVTTARLFLNVAKPHTVEMVALGFPEDWPAMFTSTIDAFESKLANRRNGRSGAAAARASASAAVADGMEAVTLLDIMVPNALENDPALMAAWQHCRRIGRKTRVGAKAAEPEAMPSESAPAVVPLAVELEVLKKAS